MNCKPGDLAIVVRDIFFPQNIGRFVWVRALANKDDFYPSPFDEPGIHWEVEPVTVITGFDDAFVVITDEENISCPDSSLRPIRDPGEDARDETLEWLPSPSKQKETA